MRPDDARPRAMTNAQPNGFPPATSGPEREPCSNRPQTGHRRGASIVAVLIVAVTAWSGAAEFAAGRPADAAAERVRGYFRQYLGRDPGSELAPWIELLRQGYPESDLQAAILGSDEYYGRIGNNDDEFIEGLFTEIDGEMPTDEQRGYWSQKLTELRGDRTLLVREYLQLSPEQRLGQPGSNEPLPRNDIRAQPGARRPGNSNLDPAALPFNTEDPTLLSQRLALAGRYFVESVRSELAGTRQGTQLVLRGNALVASADRLTAAMRGIVAQPEAVQSAFRSVSRSYSAIETELLNPPGTAPDSARVARQMRSLVNGLSNALGNGGNGPGFPGPNPPNAEYPAAQIAREVDSAIRSTQLLINLLSQVSSGGFAYFNVVRDLEQFAADLDRMRQLVQQPASLRRVQSQFIVLQREAVGLRAALSPNRGQVVLPLLTRQTWSRIERNLEQIAAVLPVDGGPGQPPGNPDAVRRLLRLIDASVAESQAFGRSIEPLVFQIAEMPRVQTSLRNLQRGQAQLRQNVVAGASIEVLRGDITGLEQSYAVLERQWNRVVNLYGIRPAPSLNPLSRDLQQVAAVITGGPGPGGGGGGIPGGGGFPGFPGGGGGPGNDGGFPGGGGGFPGFPGGGGGVPGGGGPGGGGPGGGGGNGPSEIVPDLSGFWQIGRFAPKSQPRIQQTDLDLVLSNENGLPGNGRWVDPQTIEVNWNGKVLQGRVDNNRIRWSNNDVWNRFRLLGCWFEEGRPAQVVLRNEGVSFVNSMGKATRGAVRHPAEIFDLDSRLSARIDNEQIQWADGRVWRDPLWLSGVWELDGQPCRITQDGQTLVLVNENGISSRGKVTGPNAILADDWNATAAVDSTQTRLRWSTGSVWKKVR